MNFTDSTVCLGSWGKGRSSSYALNGILRVGSSRQAATSKRIENIKISTKYNPSDDPSRGAPLRARKDPIDDWVKEAVCPEITPSVSSRPSVRIAYATMNCNCT